MALAAIPNIELVSIIVIIYAVVFGWEALIPIYVFVLVEGIVYGFGIWWISYLYIWTILMTLSILFKSIFKDNPWLWAGLSGVFGLAFGTLTAIPYLFIAGPVFTVAYIISGFTFDLLHAVGNFIAVLLIFKPCKKAVYQMKKLFYGGLT